MAWRGIGFQDYARQVAQELGVSPELALTVMQLETGGVENPATAVSSAGAIGPMQLMPATAEMLGVNPQNPYQNIRGGVQYLAQLSERFGGNPRYILSAYNAGPTATANALGATGSIPNYEQTQNYVSRGLKLLDATAPQPTTQDRSPQMPIPRPPISNFSVPVPGMTAPQRQQALQTAQAAPSPQAENPGLLSALFGGGVGNLPDQVEQAAQRRGLLMAGLGLLSASGPSMQPHSLGQDIASGLLAGRQGFQNVVDNYQQGLLNRVERFSTLQDYRMQQQQMQQAQQILANVSPQDMQSGDLSAAQLWALEQLRPGYADIYTSVNSADEDEDPKWERYQRATEQGYQGSFADFLGVTGNDDLTSSQRQVRRLVKNRGLPLPFARDLVHGRIKTKIDQFGNVYRVNTVTGEILPSEGGGGGPAPQGAGAPAASVSEGEEQSQVQIEPTGVFYALQYGVGPYSAGKALINNTIGAITGELYFEKVPSAKQALRTFSQFARQTMSMDDRLSTYQQQQINKLLPDANEWLENPAGARQRMVQLRQQLEKRIAINREALRTNKMTNTQRGKLVDVISRYQRLLKMLGQPGLTVERIQSMSVDELSSLAQRASDLPPNLKQAAAQRWDELHNGG